MMKLGKNTYCFVMYKLVLSGLIVLELLKNKFYDACSRNWQIKSSVKTMLGAILSCNRVLTNQPNAISRNIQLFK